MTRANYTRPHSNRVYIYTLRHGPRHATRAARMSAPVTVKVIRKSLFFSRSDTSLPAGFTT